MAGPERSTTTPTPTGPPAGRPPERKKGGGVLAKENRRLLYGTIVGALVAVFAVLNLDDVDVNWIFGTWQTPLILVIAVSFLLGALMGAIAAAGRRRGGGGAP